MFKLFRVYILKGVKCVYIDRYFLNKSLNLNLISYIYSCSIRCNVFATAPITVCRGSWLSVLPDEESMHRLCWQCFKFVIAVFKTHH